MGVNGRARQCLDMNRRLIELVGIAVISFGALCLAWAHDDLLFAAVFAGATVLAVMEAVRRRA
jgi:hypothetical protein